MTNINKLFSFYDVHSHEDQEKLKDLLENHLPKEYTKEIILKLLKKDIAVSSQTVRNVKTGLYKDVNIFEAIVELAKEQKVVADRIKQTLKKVV